MVNFNEKFMNILIEFAIEAGNNGHYPLAAMVVKDNEIISIAHTAIKSKCDPSAHAEVEAIRQACEFLNTPYLTNCYLYTTLEPCSMCTSLVIWSKMKGIVYGATQLDAIKEYNSSGNWRQIPIRCEEIINNSKVSIEILGEVLREECIQLFNHLK